MEVVAWTFAEAHRNAVKMILDFGIEAPTDYDVPGERLSLDLPLVIEVLYPWDPPIFSKCVWDDAKGLVDYKDEVLHGTHDDKVAQLGYTYHNRIEEQIPGVIKELSRNLHSRRAQVITWIPEIDQGSKHPPCLQRCWARMRSGRLDFHSHWRSRDTLKAWGSNVFALAHLHKLWADALHVSVGVYREFIDSAHIYGRDIEKARGMAQRPLGDWEWTLKEIAKDASR